MLDCRSIQRVSELTVLILLISSTSKELSRMFNRIAEAIQQQDPNNRSLQNTRKHFKRRRINAVDSNKRITTSYETVHITEITIRQPVGTKLM
jgi:hypothetical protein